MRVIGSGGKTIQKICADTGAKVDIEDDGSVFISAVDHEAVRCPEDDRGHLLRAGGRKAVLRQGRPHPCPSARSSSWVPARTGWCIFLKLENHWVEKVEDVLNIGDMTWVKVMEIDEKGPCQPEPEGRHARNERRGQVIVFRIRLPMTGAPHRSRCIWLTAGF